MYIQLNGQIICYEKSGEGIPVILLHGNQEDHTIYNELIPELSPQYTVYAIDTRGHGESATPKEYHYKDMAQDLLCFVKALDLDHPIVCGFSDGGIVALLAAISEPDVFRRLIVCGANLSPKGLRGSVLRSIRRHYKKSENPLEALMLTEPDICESDLARIRIPVTVLAGKHDIVRSRETKRIAAALPDATLEILKGEDHGSYVIHSDKLLKYF